MNGPSDTSIEAVRRDVARVVVPRERISARVRELAGEIASTYDGRELTIVAVLTGSLIFLADLIRELPLLMRVAVVSVTSYPGRATQSAGPRMALPPSENLAGRHVLIVDDILDSGRTMAFLLEALDRADAVSVRTCVLLSKRCHRAVPVEADFVGFPIDDEFVVGYGLDFDGRYRNLRDVCVLSPEAMSPGAGDGEPAA